MIFFVFVLFFCLGAAERRPNANYYYSPLSGWALGRGCLLPAGKTGGGGQLQGGDYMGGDYREGDYRGKGLQCGGLATVHSLAAPLSGRAGGS